MANFFVSVSPVVNRVLLGSTATFECKVDGNVDIQQYEWVGSEKIARDARFSYGESKKILYVNDVKDYDNNTWVDCTVTAVDGRSAMDNGRLFVLPMVDGLSKNRTMEGMNAGEIPPLTVGGGVVIGIGFILVIIAMFGVIRWLKRLEMQKQQDLETARNRYSRMEPSTSSRGARYDREQGNVMLGGYGPANDNDANNDSYEDMLPVVPTILIQGGSPRSAPRSGPRSGQGRYGPPPINMA